MPENLQCASCGAPINFLSGASVFAVCKYCNTAQIKSGMTLEKLGAVAELKEDYSILQIGSQGSVESKRFEVAGRIRLQWERGVWDEWYLIRENGQQAWLAEAQGFYYYSEPVENHALEINFPLSVGEKINFSNRTYTLTDRKSATCIYSEGELPFSGAVGEKYESYDLFANFGDFLSISEVSGSALVFNGKVYSYEELSFHNLKSLDGWNPE